MRGVQEASEECNRLSAALMAIKVPDKITKVVAFACCTLSGHESCEDSITQHALILTIKRILKRKNRTGDEEIRCYAQDPAYTDVDRTVLACAGIHVLEDPHAFLEVDESSVVISFAPGIAVRQIVTDLARPAIIVWDRVEKSEDEIREYWSTTRPKHDLETAEGLEQLEGRLLDPASSRLRDMVQNEYVEIQELNEGAFGDSCVYVRQCESPAEEDI